MTYEQFKEEVVSELEKRMTDGATVRLHRVLKNNNLCLDGVTILSPSATISPTIYLNNVYSALEEDGLSVAEAVELIYDKLTKNQVDASMDLSYFSDFQQVKDQIIYKLINLEQNQELLQDVPFIPYLDLAVVFCYYMPRERYQPALASDAHATILIRNEHLDLWKATPRDLMRHAKSNTPRLFPAKLQQLTQMMQQMSQTKEELPEVSDCPLLVLTNSIQYLGAAAILYRNLLKECAEQAKSDLVLLPSSIHEVLILPDTSDFTEAALTRLVQDVNASCVNREEVLSNHVYYYNRSTNQICYS